MNTEQTISDGDGPRTDDRARGDPVVTVTDLRRRFGEVTVLDGLSLTLRRGTVTALIGPNGSGKTTLLRTIAGIDDPDAGSVEVYADGSGGRSIGYLPQQPAFRPSFTVAETIRCYAELVDGADVEELLARVGLLKVRDRRVNALSGGMVRLLGIAQATVGDPPVVVLDEPTSGLDPAMTTHVFEVLADVADRGTTVLLSAHDLAAVETAADEALVLDGGEVVLTGPIESLLAATGTDSLSTAFAETVVGADGTTVRTGAGHTSQ